MVFLFPKDEQTEKGNVLFIVLLAIVLIGALTLAVQQSGHDANIDKEKLIIRIAEVRRYTAELERGITFILQNGHSESDIRFAHPDADPDYGDLSADTDKSDQMFDRLGGAAQYREPPPGINDGSAWEFYGHTALPEVGTSAADLIAVLPNVTQSFCESYNKTLGYDEAVQPEDTGTCIYNAASSRFDDGTQFYSSPNAVTDGSFTLRPSLSGCVQCTSDNTYHVFHVLMVR
tara:strand:- start:11 stop:706 length:696 start_codon:yes stop_codon:yes gene_type:complete